MLATLLALVMWPLPPAPKPAPDSPAPPVEAPEAEPEHADEPEAPAPGPAARPARPAPPKAAKPEPAEKSPVPFPHPIITEILYAVPGGDAGDANVDGVRHANGDEFIELYNPHARPIKLGGYKLADNAGVKPGQLLIVLPEMTLGPGECAVIFNGLESNLAGPVGDSTRGPRDKNDNFHGAWALSMRATSTRTSLSNSGDYVMLIAPSGAAVQLVHWGKLPKALPQCPLVEEAPTTSSGSVQRESIAGRFVPHDRLDNEPFSPGAFAIASLSAPESDPPAKGRGKGGR